MMKQLKRAFLLSFLLFSAAYSGGEELEKKRIYDAERTALEKAKQVESVLQEAEQKRQEEMEELGSNE